MKRILGWTLATFLTLCGICGPSFAEVDRSWYDPFFGKDWSLIPTGDELLVLFASTTDAPARDALVAAAGLSEVHAYNEQYRTAVYSLTDGGSVAEVAAVIAGLNGRFEVEAAAPVVFDSEGFTKYYVPRQLAVQFDKSLSDDVCRDRIAAVGSAVLHDYWTPGYYKISAPAGADLFGEIRYWNDQAEVLFTEPVYMCYNDALYVPNDPLFGNQWAMENPGTGPWLETADAHAVQAWDIQKGSPNVLIAIIDTGVDLIHEDLVDRIIPRNGHDWDFSGSGEEPWDTGNHGTACSGIALATQDNGLGVSGICPGCSLLPLKVSLSSGQNGNRADAINYGTSRRPDFDGVVMSNSWRMSSGDFTAVEAAVENAWANDCITLFASGNDASSQVSYPARYPDAIAVGASSPCDELKSFSSCDGENFWGSNYGPSQEVVAPGVLMYTTDRSGSPGYSSGDYTTSFNGTSSACPLAAGVTGLIYSQNPNLTNAEVRQILQDSSDDEVGPAGQDTPGWDQYFGYGRVNAFRAVDMASSVLESFEDDIETGGSAWSTAAVQETWNDRWHVTDRRNHTAGGSFAWRCGAVDVSPYTGRINAALISPQVLVQDGAQLRFWHFIDADESDATTALDGGVVEISNDGGESWTQVTPDGGYTHVYGPNTVLPFTQGTPMFSGSSDWTVEVLDLGDYVDDVVQVRFRFGSRGLLPPGDGGEGWYIDDVTIDLPEPASIDLTAGMRPQLLLEQNAPNPFVESTIVRFSLATSGQARIDVTDVSGRSVMTRDLGYLEAGEHSVSLDGTDQDGRELASGVYFYRVHHGTESATRRMVLQN